MRRDMFTPPLRLPWVRTRGATLTARAKGSPRMAAAGQHSCWGSVCEQQKDLRVKAGRPARFNVRSGTALAASEGANPPGG